jgi:uncharacterized protein YdhG (YjbR/CyaY superfamily)
MKKHTTIDEYIANFPEDVRERLETLRRTISDAVPEAAETISYGMPAFKLDGKVLVFIGAFKDHVGFFPTASGVAAFASELGDYDTSKGTIRLPFEKPLPLELVKRIAKFRASEVRGEG